MEFDESKQNDPEYLKEWYEYRAKIWDEIEGGEKVANHYRSKPKTTNNQTIKK